MSEITPLHDKILLKPIEEDESQHGNLIIPDMGQERPTQALVIAVGPGVAEFGTQIEVTLKPGDKVIVPKIGTVLFKHKGEEYYLIRERDILAKI
jgi:chaperonin GroES